MQFCYTSVLIKHRLNISLSDLPGGKNIKGYFQILRKHSDNNIFLSEPTSSQQLVLGKVIQLTSCSSFMEADHLINNSNHNNKKRAVHTLYPGLSMNALRHVNDTGKHFFCMDIYWSMSLDKEKIFKIYINNNTGFP